MRTLNVAYSTGDSYSMPTGVSITSLLINNTDIEMIRIFIFDSGISDQNKEKLENTVKKFGRELYFVSAKEIFERLEQYNVRGWTENLYGTYVRLFAADILYSYDVSKLLFLDADTIVINSLEMLCELKVSDDCVCSAVLGLCPSKHLKEIGLSDSTKYFNAGVLFLDVKRWRERKCGEIITNHLSNVRANYPLVDQDVLNVVLSGQIDILPIGFNTFPEMKVTTYEEYIACVEKIRRDIYYSTKEYQGIQENRIIIIHFNNRIYGKPWELGNICPWADMWEDYCKKSLWKCEKQRGNLNVELRIARFCKKHFSPQLYIFVYKVWTKIKEIGG